MLLFDKELKLLAPVSGKTISLENVSDPVFAQKLAGDGVAIEPAGNIFVSPADGELAFIFKTNHAFAIKLNNGLEVLVHIGIDTVKLEGNGFKRLVEQGVNVTAGTPIIEADLDVIKNAGFSTVTPVLVTNMEILKGIKPQIDLDVKAGIDTIIKYKKI